MKYLVIFIKNSAARRGFSIIIQIFFNIIFTRTIGTIILRDVIVCRIFLVNVRLGISI
jgi:hypothetical protein